MTVTELIRFAAEPSGAGADGWAVGPLLPRTVTFGSVPPQ
jgi:hypothetical protein